MTQLAGRSIAGRFPIVKENLPRYRNSSTNCLGEGLADGFGYRIRYARRRWEDRNDPNELPWAEVTRRCLVVLRRSNPNRKLDPGTVLDWKKEVAEPGIPEYEALAEVLGATFDWLARGIGDPPPWEPWTAPEVPGQPVVGLQSDG